MNITRENIKETLRQIMAEETEYQTFFKKALEKAGKSIPSMSDEEKKEFFNKIDAAWNAKGEKNEGNAFGAAVVAAKEKGEDEFEVDGKTYKVEESASCSCGCGTCSEVVNEEFKSKDSTFEKVYGIFDKKDYFNAKGLAKVQIGNFERALQKNDKGAQQILDKFKGDMDKAKDYIIQVITDRKKEDAFNQYKAFKAAVDSIQKGKPIYGAVDLVKSRIHNNSQKYTMALYSALRNQKFNKWKDIHADVDSLIGESVNEGRAFINAARKAKEEGKTEFEFNGKTYPVTLKESVNEVNTRLNKKVKSYLDAYLKGEKKNSPEHQHAIMLIMKGALTDANFHSEARQLDKFFPKAKQSKHVGTPMEDVIEDKGVDIAGWAKWDGYDIIDAFSFYTNMTIGGGFGNKLTTLKEAINERRLGKVDLLRSVEDGETSRVEGVKISKDLAFELRMFLQRPLLARTRTGIAIDNAQMKDAIGMLAKVGVHKRLSSGVKKEFADLLKKYK